ncbi:MAG: sodium:calcium antiporter [Dehalococcoidia bacterium]|nr:sodium:calcium antiporter [Dehalococcoidia bacterium]
MNSNGVALVAAVVGATPGVILKLSGTHLGTVPDTSLYGLSIVAAAFLLSWAAEAAEVDITQGLAVALIALIAVLPEYAVSMSFAWKAGTDPSFAPYAVANMTGGNRLLIGAAWPMVVLVVWWRTRVRELILEKSRSVEVLTLALVSIYALIIPFKRSIDLYDAAILALGFVAYMWIIARAPSEEPDLVGPAQLIGTLPRVQRRAVVGTLFVYSAVAILLSAEPFAEGLVHSGTSLGIDEFVLVQWLAPFASEAPEFLVAGLLAWRGRAAVGMGVLLSSKVNQWTLLVGGLAVAYAIASGGWHGLPLDERQTEEMLLTAAQSIFAVVVVMSLSLSTREAMLLFGMFAVTFVVPNSEVRLAAAVIYFVLAIGILVVHRGQVRALWRAARETVAETNAAARAAHDAPHEARR